VKHLNAEKEGLGIHNFNSSPIDTLAESMKVRANINQLKKQVQKKNELLLKK